MCSVTLELFIILDVLLSCPHDGIGAMEAEMGNVLSGMVPGSKAEAD
jgi:hypothetical protein